MFIGNMSNNPIRILLVRHGESEGNVDFRKYIEKGDSKVGLTPKGWEQVAGTGRFLAGFYKEHDVQKWPTLFLSPYQRTRETLSGIIHGMDGALEGEPKLYEDWRLTEKFFGAASLLSEPHPDMDSRVIATLKQMSSLIYAKDPLSAKNIFGESTKDTRAMVKSLIDGTLRRDIDKGSNEFLFVVHGAIIQAFIMNWMHIRVEDKNKIGRACGLEGNPNNGDVIEISGQTGNWTARKIWDGEQGLKMDVDMIDGIKPFSYADLPPVPDFLKKTL